MTDRFLTALGCLAAAAAVIAGFALLFSVLDEGGEARTPPAAVIEIKVPAGRTAGGAPAKSGRASIGTEARAGAAPRAGAATGRPARPSTVRDRPRRGAGFAIARVRQGARVDLESEPGGPVISRLGDKTEFGSPATLSVVETKPGWLGVTAPQLPDGEVGWVARDPSRIEVYWTRYSLRVDLASHRLELRYGRKVIGAFTVTIGGPGTETPLGRYGVTDGVRFQESPYYGCCALALSGHQTAELPPDWIGGNRLAIHGTPGVVGGSESLGCVRATDETMRYLFRRVPLGTPVFIDA